MECQNLKRRKALGIIELFHLRNGSDGPHVSFSFYIFKICFAFIKTRAQYCYNQNTKDAQKLKNTILNI